MPKYAKPTNCSTRQLPISAKVRPAHICAAVGGKPQVKHPFDEVRWATHCGLSPQPTQLKPSKPRYPTKDAAQGVTSCHTFFPTYWRKPGSHRRWKWCLKSEKSKSSCLLCLKSPNMRKLRTVGRIPLQCPNSSENARQFERRCFDSLILSAFWQTSSRCWVVRWTCHLCSCQGCFFERYSWS